MFWHSPIVVEATSGHIGNSHDFVSALRRAERSAGIPMFPSPIGMSEKSRIVRSTYGRVVILADAGIPHLTGVRLIR